MKKHILIFLLPILLVTHNYAIPRHPEYQVKALIVSNVCLNFQWPEIQDKWSTQKPFVIGVIGPNPFEKYLDVYFMERTLWNKKVTIKYTENINDALSCNVIFISKNFSGNVKTVLSLIKNKPILAICDSKDIANYGVLVYLSQDKASPDSSKVSIEISKKTYSESLLKMDPKFINNTNIRWR